ncbi:MAG: response regulator transcription factor [Ruminococcus sp.]|nr:response regulator transcription factor [Ruminococcus sp.]
MTSILIVDDDIHIGNMLQEALSDEGYSVSRAYSGSEAALAVHAARPDLILLDLMLPGLSGEELLPQIKDIPVIVMSAKADPADKVGLLRSGAADYVTKPFDLGELLARIEVQLRTRRQVGSPKLAFGGISLDTDSHTVTADGQEVKLTRTEFAILKLLMQRAGQVVAKLTILDLISEDTPDCTEDSLKIHIHNLRRKLRTVTGRDCISAVWGIGFMLTEKD